MIEDIEGGFAVVIDGQAWPIVSGWLPGEPVWTGTVGGEAIAVQVRPILNGVVSPMPAPRRRCGSIPGARRSSPP